MSLLFCRYVFAYMERKNEREKYPQSNIRIIMAKVAKCVALSGVHSGMEEVTKTNTPKALMAKYIDVDPTDNGYVSEKDFR